MTFAQKIGFLGTGQMATALGCGFRDQGIVSSQQLFGTDRSETALEAFVDATGATAVERGVELAERVDLLFLAVKPPQIEEVCRQIAPKIGREKMVVSIAAGIPLGKMLSWLGKKEDEFALVRVMPNTPCLVGQGACGYTPTSAVSYERERLLRQLLETVGWADRVTEAQLDAVTGLSGSGPAYAYQMIEALSDGGVLMGLPRSIALQLAAQTLKGAAEMVLQTGEHPGSLKDRVTSPGGTTITGIQALEEGGLRATLIHAVERATLRSIELGQGS
jgi:pyrroline-5-carboxylate reductase